MPGLNPDQVSANWGAIAKDYEQAFEGLSAQYAAHAWALLDLPRGAKVLDVAAGTGAFALHAARQGADVLATDFAPGMISRLRERSAAASVLGLIFFPDLDRGLEELRRVVRPGGRAAIVCWEDPARLPLMALVREALEKVVPGFRMPEGTPTWARLAGPQALRSRLEGAGFRSIEVVLSTAHQKIESPDTYWANFTRSAPPLAALFHRLGPDQTAAVGAAYIEALRGPSSDAAPTLTVQACIGLGRV